MNVAKQFMKQLQEGNTAEAIKTINTSLHERTIDRIGEQKADILESYGFVVNEKKKKYDEEDMDDEDESEEDEEDEDE